MVASRSPRLALLSVTDKQGLVPFAKALRELGFGLLSTGGTARALREAGVETTDVSAHTQSPEILSGRVKTLHPKIHGGILFDRKNPDHVREAAEHGIAPIDLVVVNLYRFEAMAKAQGLPLHKAIEFIDIGGPTMLRAAAKNYLSTAPVIDPSDYDAVVSDLRAHGDLQEPLRRRLAAKTFATISAYDAMIADYFAAAETAPAADTPAALPGAMTLKLERVQSLRYGENAHQTAALYVPQGEPRFRSGALRVSQGKEVSYNNLIDIDAAVGLVADFPATGVACAIIKHTNPCGTAVLERGAPVDAFKRALEADPQSAFGGIVAFNQPVDKVAAEALAGIFLECIAAPAFSDEARAVFAAKKNLRLIEVPDLTACSRALRVRDVRFGFLVQDEDFGPQAPASWKTVTDKAPTEKELRDMAFAMTVVKHVKSNAIVFARDLVTIAVGAGQMSRIDSVRFAAEKAQRDGKSLKGAVMASDAFFPFRDCVDFAASVGVTAIVQPGGSMRDKESIEAANALHLAMAFTGVRHFRH